MITVTDDMIFITFSMAATVIPMTTHNTVAGNTVSFPIDTIRNSIFKIQTLQLFYKVEILFAYLERG